MPYVIFDVDAENKSKIDGLLKDDQVSRQSIVIKDAKVFDLKDFGTLVLIEGEESALKKAEELFSEMGKKIGGTDRDDIYKKFKDEEGAVLGGIGLIFEG
jgi:hypothetical protein